MVGKDKKKKKKAWKTEKDTEKQTNKTNKQNKQITPEKQTNKNGISALYHIPDYWIEMNTIVSKILSTS